MKRLIVYTLLLTTCSVLTQTPQGAFDRIMLINMENNAQKQAIQRYFMKYLSTKGTYLPNYFGITHPSQPNYSKCIIKPYLKT
jgi:hypothetical protein